MNNIGRRIYEIRLRRGMTQEELGNAIGESKQTIYKYEHGIVTNIPITKVEKLAEVLDCPPTYLAGWDKDDSEEQIKNAQREMISDLVDRLSPEAQSLVIAQLKGLAQSQTTQDDHQES